MERSCSEVALSTRSRVRFGHREDKIENTPARRKERERRKGMGEGVLVWMV